MQPRFSLGAIPPPREKGQLKMRPFTICYGLMTLALGAVTFYGIANAEDLRDPFRDMKAANSARPAITLRAPASKSSAKTEDSCCTAIAAPAESVASTETAESNETMTVVAGMSTDEVRAMLGEPDEVSSDGARWTYGSSVLIFNDDRLSGHVAFDPLQAAMNRHGNLMASLTDSTMVETPRSSSGPKVLHANTAPSARDRALPYRQVVAGSARNAYRYNSNQQAYSYYMNRAGPLDRLFNTKRYQPRGMTNSTQRNVAQAYFNMSTPRYGGAIVSQQYRR